MLNGTFVAQGDIIPRGCGLSYYCFDRLGFIVHPIPLNLLIRWGRNIRFWLMCTLRPSWADKRFIAMYRRGEQAAEKRFQDRLARIDKIVDDILDQR